MKAILIDPHSETISEVVYSGDWKSIKLWIDADTFDCAYIDNQDVLYLDDEGLFRADVKFFYIAGAAQPFAGKALVLGSTDDGDTVGVNVSVETLRQNVRFMDAQTVRQLASMGAFE